MKLPNFYFINCIGSYLFGLFNYYADEESKDDVLFFLSKIKLRYFNLKPEDYSNPWGYQPLNYDLDGGFYLDSNWLLELFDYLKSHYNIICSREIYDSSFDIDNFLQRQMELGENVIVAIDEYYNRKNDRLFEKEHHLHAVIVKSYDEKNKSYIVVDSNYAETYSFSANDIQKAFLSEHNTYSVITVSCALFNNNRNLQIAGLFEKSLEKQLDFSCLNEGVRILKNVDEETNGLFVIDGINCSISAKVLPYVHYFQHLIVRNELLEQTKREKLVLLFDEQIKNLNFFVYMNLMMITKKNYKFLQKNIEKLEEVVAGFQNIVTLLKKQEF